MPAFARMRAAKLCPACPAPPEPIYPTRPHHGIRARSSAGEHYLDMVGVTGSIPVPPPISAAAARRKKCPPVACAERREGGLRQRITSLRITARARAPRAACARPRCPPGGLLVPLSRLREIARYAVALGIHLA